MCLRFLVLTSVLLNSEGGGGPQEAGGDKKLRWSLERPL